MGGPSIDILTLWGRQYEGGGTVSGEGRGIRAPAGDFFITSALLGELLSFSGEISPPSYPPTLYCQLGIGQLAVTFVFAT